MKITSRIPVVILGIILYQCSAYADEAPVEAWNKSIETKATARDIAAGDNGIVYVCGLDFDADTGQCILLKYDNEGNLLWDRRDAEGSESVTVGDDGRVYVTGLTNHDEIMLSAYNESGTLSWDETSDYPTYQWVCGLSVCGSAIYMASIVEAGDYEDARLIKWSTEGDTLWTRTFHTDDQYEEYLDVASKGSNAYTTGIFGVDNFYTRIMKYDSGGNVLWNKEYLVENAYGECIELDGNENVYIAGGIYGDADATGLLLKYDKEGNLLWDKDYDFLEKLEFSGMAIDAEGYVYVTGNYRMPGKTRDIMTCKISPQGDTLWTKKYESNFLDWTDGIAVDNTGGVYIAITSLDTLTLNRTMRTIKYQQATSVKEAPAADADFLIAPLYTAGDKVLLRYSTGSASSADLRFYSADGRLCGSYTLSPSPSPSTFTWNAPDQAAGVYFARMSADKKSSVAKIVLKR